MLPILVLLALCLLITGSVLSFVPLKRPQEVIDLADPQYRADESDKIDAELLAFLSFDSKSTNQLPANLKKMLIEKNIEKNKLKSE